MAYFSLFFASFASATLLPGGSEVLLAYLLYEQFDPIVVIGIATLGNTLGSLVNYLIGKYAIDFAFKHHYIQKKSLLQASSFFKKYGGWSLLLSWVPIIGDPLTLFAGIMHYPMRKFLWIVGCTKMVRYIVVYLGFNLVSL